MSNEPNTISVIAAPPIDTLTELRRQNSALLQRDVAGAGTTRPTPGELLGFLESASKLGRSLQDEDSRETAQGIMDVWIAALLSRDPGAADGTRPFTLEPPDEHSATLVSNDARQLRKEAVAAASRADDILPAAPQLDGLKKPVLTRAMEHLPEWVQPIVFKVTGRDADTNVLQRLLLRFVRLKEKSLEAYSVPLAGDDDILREPKAQELLKQLIQAGVVKQQEAASDAPLSYVLVHESLITKWGLLSDFVMQRKAFRELSRGWENGGRQRGALLTAGAQLQQAIDYPHLDSSEQQFLETSRRAEEKNRRSLTSFVLTVMVALTGLTAWLWISNVRLTKAEAHIQQSLAVAKTTQSLLLSLLDQLESGKTEPEPIPAAMSEPVRASVEAILRRFKARFNAEKKDETLAMQRRKPMVEIFVGLKANLTPSGMAEKCRKELEQEGFVLPADVSLPRKNVPDGVRYLTEVKYFHADDLPLVKKVIAALGKAGIPEDKIVLEDKTADTSAPKLFIQISLAEKLTN